MLTVLINLVVSVVFAETAFMVLVSFVLGASAMMAHARVINSAFRQEKSTVNVEKAILPQARITVVISTNVSPSTIVIRMLGVRTLLEAMNASASQIFKEMEKTVPVRSAIT